MLKDKLRFIVEESADIVRGGGGGDKVAAGDQLQSCSNTLLDLAFPLLTHALLSNYASKSTLIQRQSN